MTKKHYCLILLCPAVLYYLALSLWPQTLTALLWGWPLSVLLGLSVILWAIVVGLKFAHGSVVKAGRHE